MVIKTNYDRLSDLAKKLKNLERDIADISYKVTRLSNTTAQSVKYGNTEYSVKRAADRVIQSANETNRYVKIACDRLEGQSKVIKNSVSSYKAADKIDKVNGAAVSKVGTNLGGIFNYRSFADYISTISIDISRFL